MIFEATQSAFDQFSVGHFIMGAVIFFFIFIILNRFYKKEFTYSSIIFMAFLIATIIGICWEILENSTFFISIKFNETKDSLLNMSVDIILNISGAFTVIIIFWCIDIKYKTSYTKKKERLKIKEKKNRW